MKKDFCGSFINCHGRNAFIRMRYIHKLVRE